MARKSNRRRGLLASRLGICAFAFALVFGTGPAAAAETLQLTCEATSAAATNYSQTIKVHVDFDTQLIKLANQFGEAIAWTTDRRWNALAPSVRISDAAISWRLANSKDELIFEGLLDRENGDLSTVWVGRQGTYANAPVEMKFFGGRCRRATQKF